MIYCPAGRPTANTASLALSGHFSSSLRTSGTCILKRISTDSPAECRGPPPPCPPHGENGQGQAQPRRASPQAAGRRRCRRASREPRETPPGHLSWATCPDHRVPQLTSRNSRRCRTSQPTPPSTFQLDAAHGDIPDAEGTPAGAAVTAGLPAASGVGMGHAARSQRSHGAPVRARWEPPARALPACRARLNPGPPALSPALPWPIPSPHAPECSENTSR